MRSALTWFCSCIFLHEFCNFIFNSARHFLLDLRIIAASPGLLMLTSPVSLNMLILNHTAHLIRIRISAVSSDAHLSSETLLAILDCLSFSSIKCLPLESNQNCSTLNSILTCRESSITNWKLLRIYCDELTKEKEMANFSLRSACAYSSFRGPSVYFKQGPFFASPLGLDKPSHFSFYVLSHVYKVFYFY